jgi:membrane-bound serine protease (ClpP class)
MKKNKKFLTIVLLGLFFIFLLCANYFAAIIGKAIVQPEDDNPNSLVIVATIDGAIKEGTVKYLRRVINVAEDKRADYLVIKLHTPGGLLTATESIVTDMQETNIPVAVFVYRPAGWGYSAGTFILMAADIAAMHPYAIIGAARPAWLLGIEANPPVIMEGNKEILEEQPKIVESMAKWIGSLAEANERNAEIAEQFVRDNLTLRGREALQYGVIDLIAFNLDELLQQGTTARDPEIVYLGLNFSERLFNFFSHPSIVPLFLIFGLLGIAIAIQSRELEIGVIALIPLALGIWGLGIIEFNALSIFLIFLGLIFLIVELLTFAGFGALGIGGIVAILIGIIGFGAEPFLRPVWYDTLVITAVIITIIGCLFFIVVSRAIVKTLKTKPQTGIESLIGKKVEVIEDLKPKGRVVYGSEIWRAESFNQETICKKEEVEIIRIEGNVFIVKRVDNK